MPKTLIVVPLTEELIPLRLAWDKIGLDIQEDAVGRVGVLWLPALGFTVALAGLGKSECAVVTQHLIDAQPGWDLVICAGSAGALDPRLSVGDVVVGTKTVEHDLHNLMGPPRVPRFRADAAAVRSLRRVTPEGFGVHFGPLASGDEDVISAARREAIRTRTGALATAWEGAGAARACRFSRVPFVEIRAISDTADAGAAVSFFDNLDQAMANLAGLLTAWIRHP